MTEAQVGPYPTANSPSGFLITAPCKDGARILRVLLSCTCHVAGNENKT